MPMTGVMSGVVTLYDVTVVSSSKFFICSNSSDEDLQSWPKITRQV